MRTHLLILCAAATAMAVACKKPTQAGREPEDSGGDGGDGGTDSGEELCSANLLETDPISGATNVYYRAQLGATFDDDASTATFSLIDAQSAQVPIEVTWGDDNRRATIEATDGLAPDSAYTLGISVCETSHEVGFTTSRYGAPLEIPASDLIGRTYHLDFAEATYTQPPGLGPIIGNYLSDPILVYVTDASDADISFLGAQGKTDTVTGDISQDMSLPTWDLGTASFAEAPYFESTPSKISVLYDTTLIPLWDFSMSGTFEPDGSSAGGGVAQGMADTRNMGPLLDLGDDPQAVCEYVSGFGIDCEACPDGPFYCLTIVAELPPSPHLEGVVLEAVEDPL